MKIPRSEAEVKQEFRTWWTEWEKEDPRVTPYDRFHAVTRLRALEWMLGFKSHEEAAKWAGIDKPRPSQLYQLLVPNKVQQESDPVADTPHHP